MNKSLVHSRIQKEQPDTVSKLFKLLLDMGCKNFKIYPVFYFGHLQGVRVSIYKSTLPSRTHVYSIVK